MLVLTRNRSQQVLIGDDIIVTIVEARNGKVRIGIDAPQDVLILRPEVLAKQREQAKAIAEVQLVNEGIVSDTQEAQRKIPGRG